MSTLPGRDLAALEEVLDHAPCGFVSFTDDGRIVRVNRTLLDMLGRTREELLGAHIESLLTVGSRVFYQTHLFPLVRMRGRADEIFLLLKSAAGGDVGVLMNIVRHERHERDGAAIYDTVMMRVQERQKYEEELLRARRAADEARKQIEEQAAELEATTDELIATNEELLARTEEANRLREIADTANRSKSGFLAMISHELRTPLNAISGYVQILEMGVQGPVNEKQRAMLERIDRSQAHLLGLIDEILDLSKIEAGGTEYEIGDVRLADVVGVVSEMVEPQLAGRGLGFDVDVSPELVARADPDKVRQILINLLSNAIKFTPAGGTITLGAGAGAGTGAEAGDGGGAKTVFASVRDTGIGIAPEQQSSVFEPFVQVHEKRDGQAQGTGLGLAISRDLARGMGGDLTLESTPGAGSTFTLTLPAA